MYWLEILMPDDELMVWEHLQPRQVINLRNAYIRQGLKTRTGKHDKKVDNNLNDANV